MNRILSKNQMLKIRPPKDTEKKKDLNFCALEP